MSDEVAFFAQKSPHSTGEEKGIFPNSTNAKGFVERCVDAEPEVQEAEWRETRYGYCYEVTEGVGRVAGYVEHAPLHAPANPVEQCASYGCTNKWDAEKRVQLEDGWVFDVRICDECKEMLEE